MNVSLYPHPKPADYSQKNPLASSAHNKLLTLAASIGWPKHYQNDLYHHDWTTLRDAPTIITRLIWGVRETGTDLWLWRPEESYGNPLTASTDWFVANMQDSTPRIFYYLNYDLAFKRWSVSALPHSLPECLDKYRSLTDDPRHSTRVAHHTSVEPAPLQGEVVSLQTYTVDYSSNNSGGYWWLKDEDWYALEQAGWTVEWVKDDPYYQKFRLGDDDRWLGALAKRASLTLQAYSLDAADSEARRQWEAAVHQDPEDLGCDCCGQPHYFYAQLMREVPESAPKASDSEESLGSSALSDPEA